MRYLYTFTITSTTAPIGGRSEEQGAVLVDPARLHRAQRRPGLGGDVPGAVDGAVDDPLVDVAVEPPADHPPGRGRRR